VIFLHISVGNETPTQNQVKLIAKMVLTAKWEDYVSNLMFCFSCFVSVLASAEDEQKEECDATA